MESELASVPNLELTTACHTANFGEIKGEPKKYKSTSNNDFQMHFHERIFFLPFF